MINNSISAEDRNKLKSRLQLSYCKVRVTRENIESINKVSMALDNRIRRVDVNIDDIIGSDIYLILGGGVRYVRNKAELNKNLSEVDWNKLLNEIDERFG